MAKRESLRRQTLQVYLEKTDKAAPVKPGPNLKAYPGLIGWPELEAH
jgi:hypothetical protein